MNTYYFVAAVLAFLLGIAHSLLGELLIFRNEMPQAVPIGEDSPKLSRRRLWAIWSTWHLLTLFGWGLAGIFLWMAFPSADIPTLGAGLAALFVVSAMFWFVGTRRKHPAWIVFLVIAVLLYLGSR